MDFYMHLPSNSNPNLYKDNKTSSFKVQLSQRLELRGQWQVALIELHYPNTLHHVQEGSNWIKILKPQTDRFAPNEKSNENDPIEQKTFVPRGHYTTTEFFIQAVREALRPLAIPPTGGTDADPSVYQNEEGRIMVTEFKHWPRASYEFDPILAHQLGLPSPGPYSTHDQAIGVRPVQRTLGTPSQMFVYLNIIQDQIVGHTKAPLLRTIATATSISFGGMTSYRAEQPFYFDLATKSFDTLEIDIRSHTGGFMPFEHGTCTVVLHFRQSS